MTVFNVHIFFRKCQYIIGYPKTLWEDFYLRGSNVFHFFSQMNMSFRCPRHGCQISSDLYLTCSLRREKIYSLTTLQLSRNHLRMRYSRWTKIFRRLFFDKILFKFQKVKWNRNWWPQSMLCNFNWLPKFNRSVYLKVEPL